MYNNHLFSNLFSNTALLLVVLVFIAIFVAIILVCYIFQSIGLYQIAKRKGLEHEAFWAWIPIGSQYLMGRIAERSFSGINLSLLTPLLSGIGILVSYIPYIGILGGLITIAAAVFQFICLFQIYKQQSPGNEVLHTVLSVIIPAYSSFALFALRNR